MEGASGTPSVLGVKEAQNSNWGCGLISTDLPTGPGAPTPSPQLRARTQPPSTVNGVAQSTLVLQFLPLGHLWAQKGAKG